MFHEIYHIPRSPLCPPTWGDTWLKTWDELIYCKKQLWLRWSSLHLWSTSPFLSLDNRILDHCKYPSSFSSPLFLFQLKSLIEMGSPERAAGFLAPGAGTWTRKEASPAEASTGVARAMSCGPLWFRSAFPFPPVEILCLEQPVPWTGFRHPEPGVREGASGPCSGFANLGMKSQGLWLTLSAEYCCCCRILTTAKCRYKPLTCEKCFPGKRIALGNTGSAAGLLTLQSCLAHCDLGQVAPLLWAKGLKTVLST